MISPVCVWWVSHVSLQSVWIPFIFIFIATFTFTFMSCPFFLISLLQSSEWMQRCSPLLTARESRCCGPGPSCPPRRSPRGPHGWTSSPTQPITIRQRDGGHIPNVHSNLRCSGRLKGHFFAGLSRKRVQTIPS